MRRLVGKGQHHTSLHTPCTDTHAQVLSILFVFVSFSFFFMCCRHEICVDGASACQVWRYVNECVDAKWRICANGRVVLKLSIFWLVNAVVRLEGGGLAEGTEAGDAVRFGNDMAPLYTLHTTGDSVLSFALVNRRLAVDGWCLLDVDGSLSAQAVALDLP